MNEKPTLQVADIFKAGFKRYLAEGISLPAHYYKVANALMTCHTAAAGGHIYQCNDCGHSKISYNSCRNRHCPSCQGAASIKWVDKRLKELLPVHYFHLVFTIPSELNQFVLRNKEVLYAILFRSASETLQEIAADPRHLGAKQGILAVLHTWGSNMQDHPHLHCLVPAGGLDETNKSWKKIPNREFIFPVKVLSSLFRGKFLHYFRSAINAQEIGFHGNLERFVKDKSVMKKLIDDLYSKDWVVYAKAPFTGPAAVIKYLARYTHRIAISNSRLVAMTKTHVTFRFKDYSSGGVYKNMTVTVNEFIRRFLLHILPSGFMRIRYYGLFSQKSRKKLKICIELLGEPIVVADKKHSWVELIVALTGYNRKICPNCGKEGIVKSTINRVSYKRCETMPKCA